MCDEVTRDSWFSRGFPKRVQGPVNLGKWTKGQERSRQPGGWGPRREAAGEDAGMAGGRGAR